MRTTNKHTSAAIADTVFAVKLARLSPEDRVAAHTRISGLLAARYKKPSPDSASLPPDSPAAKTFEG
jgi:hypothetical protein